METAPWGVYRITFRVDRRILAGRDIVFCQLEALLSFFCSEWLQILDFFPDAQPAAKCPFNSTLAQARLQNKVLMMLGVEEFFREVSKGEKSAILPSVDSRGIGYPGKVRALDRHDLVLLGFAECDYSDVRDWD